MSQKTREQWTAVQQTMPRELVASLGTSLVIGEMTPDEVAAVLEELLAWVRLTGKTAGNQGHP